jgi:O6-methylguanine-DNA--protein-cysteine methyltransferase
MMSPQIYFSEAQVRAEHAAIAEWAKELNVSFGDALVRCLVGAAIANGSTEAEFFASWWVLASDFAVGDDITEKEVAHRLRLPVPLAFRAVAVAVLERTGEAKAIVADPGKPN